MNKLRHPVVSLIFFAVLTSLAVTIYTGLESQYSIEEGYTQYSNETQLNTSIMKQLKSLGIMTAVAQIETSVDTLKAPTGGGGLDILGALASAGTGVLKLVVGIFTFPVQILNIIFQYYELPGIVQIGIWLIIVALAMFIILSAYLRAEI